LIPSLGILHNPQLDSSTCAFWINNILITKSVIKDYFSLGNVRVVQLILNSFYHNLMSKRFHFINKRDFIFVHWSKKDCNNSTKDVEVSEDDKIDSVIDKVSSNVLKVDGSQDKKELLQVLTTFPNLNSKKLKNELWYKSISVFVTNPESAYHVPFSASLTRERLKQKILLLCNDFKDAGLKKSARESSVELLIVLLKRYMLRFKYCIRNCPSIVQGYLCIENVIIEKAEFHSVKVLVNTVVNVVTNILLNKLKSKTDVMIHLEERDCLLFLKLK